MGAPGRLRSAQSGPLVLDGRGAGRIGCRLGTSVASWTSSLCGLTTPHKLQGGGEVGKPVPGTVRQCVGVAKRRPRPVSFMRWLGR